MADLGAELYGDPTNPDSPGDTGTDLGAALYGQQTPQAKEDWLAREARLTFGIGGNADLRSSAIGRLMEAAARPAAGIAQLVTGGNQAVTDRINQARQQAESSLSPGETNVAGYVGEALSPTTMIPAARLAPYAVAGSQLLGRVAQGAGVGAATALATPVENTQNFDVEKSKQALGGLITGGLLPPILEGTLKLGGAAYRAAIEPWLNPASIKGRFLLSRLGDKADDVINLLRGNDQTIVPGSSPTAGEAAIGANSTGLSSLQKEASQIPGDVADAYLARTDQQNAARIAAMRTIGQDEPALNAAIATRSAVASPLYEVARNGEALAAAAQTPEKIKNILDLVDQGKLNQSQAIQELQQFATSSLTPDAERSALLSVAKEVPSTPGTGVLAQTGKVPYPLQQKVSSVVDNINQTLSENPGNPALLTTLGQIKTGLLDSAGNVRSDPQEIASALDGIKAAIANKDNAFIVKNLTQIKNDLAAAIPGYNTAQAKFSELSRPVNQMQVGQYLEKKLVPALDEQGKQKAASFAQAVTEAPTTIKRATGAPRYDNLSQVLTPEQMNTVNSVQQDLARLERMGTLANRAKGNIPLNRIGADSMQSGANNHIPGMLSRAYTIAKALFTRSEGVINEKLASEIAMEMLNPGKFGETLAKAKTREAINRARADALMKYRLVPSAISGQIGGAAQ